MRTSSGENVGGLLVLSGIALGMLQVDLAEFLGVSARTMRRWTVGGVRLGPRTLHTLVHAVHPRDAGLAARLAAAHGRLLEDLLRPLPPARDPAADRRLARALLLLGARTAGVSAPAMRAALVAVLSGAQTAGLTLEYACALLGDAGTEGG